jgi:hypothetical protein
MQSNIEEEYSANDKVFYCNHDKTWRRKLGCKWRAQVEIDDCSISCKQAIKENVFLTTKIKQRTKIKRRIL